MEQQVVEKVTMLKGLKILMKYKIDKMTGKIEIWQKEFKSLLGEYEFFEGK